MNSELYKELADVFIKIGFGGRHCPELYALLESLFNEEEARIALNLSPFAPEPPEKVAERMGEDPEKIARILDVMADNGVIYCSQKGDIKWYKTIQLVPGIFELQFMKGEYTPRAKELAQLFDAYHNASRALAEKRTEPPKRTVSFARVIPIEESITPDTNIFSYEEVERYINQTDMITLSSCYCRHEHRLLDRGCEYPDDVCLQFGPFARFVRDRGFGREITREEAREVMKRSADAGLIATSSNTRERIDFICNCCTCCCGVLRSVKISGAPVRSVSSNFQAEVEAESCIGCGDCVERCQMDAISLVDDIAKVDPERCLGCGVCIRACSTESLTLVRREDVEDPPRSFGELIERQAQAASL